MRVQMDDTAEVAAVLLERWRRLGRAHVPVAFGCGCGGYGHIGAADFAQDVLAFLAEKHGLAGTPLLGGPGAAGDDGLSALLRRLAVPATGPELPLRRHLLADLDRSLASWERAAGMRPAAGRLRADAPVAR